MEPTRIPPAAGSLPPPSCCCWLAEPVEDCTAGHHSKRRSLMALKTTMSGQGRTMDSSTWVGTAGPLEAGAEEDEAMVLAVGVGVVGLLAAGLWREERSGMSEDRMRLYLPRKSKMRPCSIELAPWGWAAARLLAYT